MKNYDFGLPPNMMFFLRIEDGLFLVKSDLGGKLKKWTAAALDGRTRATLDT